MGGATCFGLFALSVSKGKRIVKLGNKLQRSANQNRTPSVTKHPAAYAPNRELPQTKAGISMPDPEAQGRAYTQLGTVTRPKKGYSYTKAREFDEHGKAVRDIEFTDHGRKNHPNPHQHQWKPNETGGTLKRGNPEPLNISLKKISKDAEAPHVTPKPNAPKSSTYKG